MFYHLVVRYIQKMSFRHPLASKAVIRMFLIRHVEIPVLLFTFEILYKIKISRRRFFINSTYKTLSYLSLSCIHRALLMNPKEKKSDLFVEPVISWNKYGVKRIIMYVIALGFHFLVRKYIISSKVGRLI